MSQWTIGKKTAAGFLVVLLQALSVGVYALCMTVYNARQLRQISTDYVPETQIATKLERNLLNARINFIYFATIQKEGSLEQGWQYLHGAGECLPPLQRLISSSDRFVELRPAIAKLQHDFDSYQPVLSQVIQMVQNGQNHTPEFKATLKEWARLGSLMVASAGQLSSKGMEVTAQLADQTSSQNQILILSTACVLGLVVGLALIVWVTRDTNRSLRQRIGELSGAAGEFGQAARTIAGMAQPLADGAAQQVALLEETSSSIDQIRAMAERNAGHSATAAQKMSQAAERMQHGHEQLHQMVAAMQAIQLANQKVSTIVKGIDEIAFQTNILALNAAVEAARAGDAGLGFAVVADEVRSLAQRCAESARSTAELIDESGRTVVIGQSKLQDMTVAIGLMRESATQGGALVDDVRRGSGEQADGVALVARALQNIQHVTQATAAQAQQSSSAGEELSAQANALHGIIEKMTVMVGSGTSATSSFGV